MSYLPEDIRTKVIDQITANATTPATFYRAPDAALDAEWPAFVLEYGDNQNLWAGSSSDRKIFMFNLYVAYKYDPDDQTSRETAEVGISNAIGELYRDVFEKPDVLNLPNGWLRASDVTWGYMQDMPVRMAMMQIAVTVHQDRS